MVLGGRVLQKPSDINIAEQLKQFKLLFVLFLSVKIWFSSSVDAFCAVMSVRRDLQKTGHLTGNYFYWIII